MHPVRHENSKGDPCRPIEHEDCPYSEPVDMILAPSRTDSPNVQSSPNESKPLQTTTLPRVREVGTPRPPPVIPPEDPHRGLEKRTWFSRFCIKVMKKLHIPRTGEDRKKPRNTKKRNKASVRRRGYGGGGYTNPGVTQPFFVSPVFGGAAFAGAGAACAASCGAACGC